MRHKLMVARFPGNNQEHPASSGWVIGLQEKLIRDGRIGAVVPFRESDTPITMVRNRAVKQALAQCCDYLLMIDSDMQPDCEPHSPPFWDIAWEFMMARRERELQIVRNLLGDMTEEEALAHAMGEVPPATIAAPYCGPPPQELVYVFEWKSRETDDPSAGNRFALGMVDREDAFRRTGVQEVAALPTGLILYDTRVFRKLPTPWFEYEWGDEERTEKITTEDVFQTRNASMLGLPQFVAWDCWAGHHKLKLVRKPRPVTVEYVRQSVADAIKAGRSDREKLSFR